MLKLIYSLHQLSFSSLMEVYNESNLLNGREKYLNVSAFEQLREAELDFYQYLSSVFFRQKDSYYAVWVENENYVSALRVEPYLDGLLLCALETLPNARCMGYAFQLISAVIQDLTVKGCGRLYSHVSKQNMASLKVHLKCGFQVIKDHAVYSDGSVLPGSYTLVYEYEKSET